MLFGSHASYQKLWWFSLEPQQTNWFTTEALSQHGDICMYNAFSCLQPRPPYYLHVQACCLQKCNVARESHYPWDPRKLLRECWCGVEMSTPSLSFPLSLLSLTHSQKCENKVNNTTSFMWLQVKKDNDCWLSSHADELQKEKFTHKKEKNILT